MKCQRCGSEIKKGEVFCYECGEEVQLVPDFNPLDSIMQQQKAQEEQKRKVEEERLKRLAKEAERKKKKRRTMIMITILSLLIVVGLGVGTFYFIQYKQDNSYEYQYAKAYEAYELEDYYTAELYGKKALELSPNSDNAILLMAEVNYNLQNIEECISLFMTYIEKHPDSVDAYGRLITIYQELDQLENIKLLMEACNNDIVLTELAQFVPIKVEFVSAPGEYSKKTAVELTSKGGMVYYTMDGTDPTEMSSVYTLPILLGEGTTVFKAIAYSSAGIPGDMIEGEFIITLARPNPPFISPVSGDYEVGTEITIVVPDGCTAYYSFDGVATRNSKKYTEPISMEEGEYVFSAIIVDENDKESFPSSETYVVDDL